MYSIQFVYTVKKFLNKFNNGIFQWQHMSQYHAYEYIILNYKIQTPFSSIKKKSVSCNIQNYSLNAKSTDQQLIVEINIFQD